MSAEVSSSREAWTRLQGRASNDHLSLADIFSIGNEARRLPGDIAPSQRVAVLGNLTMDPTIIVHQKYTGEIGQAGSHNRVNRHPS